jgi:hypothetical protein
MTFKKIATWNKQNNCITNKCKTNKIKFFENRILVDI